MADLHPPVEPYDHGMLDVGDGHSVYWEVCGHPEGTPAVMVHGGPGQVCNERMRRKFGPGRDRAVLFDQRGCGRSTPGVLIHGRLDLSCPFDTARALDRFATGGTHRAAFP